MSTSHHVGKHVGNYVLIEQLSTGAMGETFLAEHPELGRRAAVKLLDGRLGEHPIAYQRFLTEAKSIARINHPNIIDIYDFGRTDDGHIYYIMEALTGSLLSEVLEQTAPMEPAATLPYVEQLCAGLTAAHEAGVIHRDLKPENIFVQQTPDLLLKIFDFGIAKLAAPDSDVPQVTIKGIVMGTPLTMSPEQAVGQSGAITLAADLYSLGVIVYWMLVGRPPFADGPAAVIMARHIEEPPPPLGEVCPHAVPAAVVEVVERCLCKNPEERPASADEVAQAYRNALAPRPIARDTDEPQAADWSGAIALSEQVPDDIEPRAALSSPCFSTLLDELSGQRVVGSVDDSGAPAAAPDDEPQPAPPRSRLSTAARGWLRRRGGRSRTSGQEPTVDSEPDVSLLDGPTSDDGAAAVFGAADDGPFPDPHAPSDDGSEDNSSDLEPENLLALGASRGAPVRGPSEIRRRLLEVDGEDSLAAVATDHDRFPDESDPALNAHHGRDNPPDDEDERFATQAPLGVSPTAAVGTRGSGPLVAFVTCAALVLTLGGGALLWYRGRAPGSDGALIREQPSPFELYLPRTGARPQPEEALELTRLPGTGLAQLRQQLIASMALDGTLAAKVERLGTSALGRDPAALATLLSELDARAPSGAARHLLSRLLALSGADLQAAAQLNRAAATRPADPAFQAELSLAFAELLHRSGQLSRAEAAYQQAGSAPAQAGVVRFRLGEVHQAMGQLPAARRAYHECASQAPALATIARCKEAESYVQQGNLSMAVALYKNALPRGSSADSATAADRESLVFCRLGLAYAYGRLGRPQPGLAELTHVLRLSPDSAVAHFYRGTLLYNASKPKLAIRAYLEAVRLDPDLAEAHYRLGQLYQQAKATELAKKHYRAALAARPNFPAAQLALTGIAP